MKTLLLSGGDTRLGENSKDLDTSLSQGEASLLKNLLPGAGAPRPRYGCGPYTDDSADSILHLNGSGVASTGMRVAPFEFYGEKIVFHFDPTAQTIKAIYEDGRIGNVAANESGSPALLPCFELDDYFVIDGMMFFSAQGNLYRLQHDKGAVDEHTTWEVIEAQRSYRGEDVTYNKWYAAQLIIDSATKAPITPYQPIIWSSALDQTSDKMVNTPRQNAFMYAYYLITYVSRPDIAANATSTQYGPVIFESRHTRADTRPCAILKAPLVVAAGLASGFNAYDSTGFSTVSPTLSLTGAGFSSDMNKIYKDATEYGFRDTATMGQVNVLVTMPRDNLYTVTPGGSNPYITAQISQGAASSTPFYAEFPDVTHMRIYRTLFYPTLEQASGAPMRFLVDIPIENARLGDPYVDSTTDEELLGSLYTYDLFSAVDLPIGSALHFFKGNAWSIANDKIYASVTPSNPTLASRWIPYCKTSTDWFTTSVGNSDKPIAVSDDKENVIAFGGNSVWALLNGDLTIGAQKIADDVGIRGPRCLVQSDVGLVFLSYSGPYVVNGLQVRPFEAWKVNTIHRPKTRQHTIDEWANGVLINASEMILADNFAGRVAGFYYGPTTGGMGGFSIEYANAMAFEDYCSFSDQTLIGITKSTGVAEISLKRLFDSEFKMDAGHPFECKYISGAYKYEPSQWERFPQDDRSYLELFDMSLDSKIFQSPAVTDFTLFVVVDDRFTIQSNLRFIPAYDDQRLLYWQSDLQFGFKQGVCGRFIKFGWSTDTPEDFVVYSWSARAFRCKNPPPRFTVSDQELMTILSPVPDLISGYSITDSTGPEIT